MIDICLSGLPTNRILAYMDDIVIFSETFSQHIQGVEAVFERLRAANISLKASKSVEQQLSRIFRIPVVTRRYKATKKVNYGN